MLQLYLVFGHWRPAMLSFELKPRVCCRRPEAQNFSGILQDLAIEFDTRCNQHMLGDTLQLARRFKQSTYDAPYLELALRAERVNDIETPEHINLVCKDRVFSSGYFPAWVG
jgi:hypothetical protein